MNIGLILALSLSLSLLGNVVLGKLYVSAKQDVARVEQAFDSFKAQVKAEGEAATKKAAVTQMADKLKKDTADAENAAARASDQRTIASLRRDADRARGSIVPAAPAGSSRPELACYDRASLESALRDLIAGVRGIADEGTAATVDLDTARRWAQGSR